MRAPPVSSKRIPTERRGAVPSLILNNCFHCLADPQLNVLIGRLTLIYVNLPAWTFCPACCLSQLSLSAFNVMSDWRLSQHLLFAFTFLATLNGLYESNAVKVMYSDDGCLPLFERVVSCFGIIYSCELQSIYFLDCRKGHFCAPHKI